MIDQTECDFFQVTSGSEDDSSEVDDDDLLWDDMTINSADSPVSGSFVPPAGAPFSALTPSIWPQDILARIQQVQLRKCWQT